MRLTPKQTLTSKETLPGKQTLTGFDYVALAIATCGVGFIPVAPGTFGSLVGLGIFLLLGSLPLQVVAIVVVTWAGIWAASRSERILGLKDPGKVVIDEVAGQLVALLPVWAFVGGLYKTSIIISFTLFRLFDIFKPYPARKFEALRGGLGIMADDLVAGVYAALLVSLFAVWRGGV